MFRIFLLLLALTVQLPAHAASAPVIDARTFGVKCDGSTDDYAAIIKARNEADTTGGKLLFPPGTCITNTQIDLTVNSIDLSGAGSAYSYENRMHARTIIKAGAAMTNVINLIASEGVTYTNYTYIHDLVIDGNGLASRCINVAGANLIQRVTAAGCKDAGFRLGDLTNSTHLDDVSAVANTGGTGYGLLVQGTSTTTYSVSNSNFRQNVVGVRLEAGLNFSFDGQNTIESNTGAGMSIYRASVSQQVGYGRITAWFENNFDGGTGYQLVIDSGDPTNLAAKAGYIDFLNSKFNAVASEKAIHLISSRNISFHNLAAAGAIDFDAQAYYTSIWNQNGGTITDNGNRNYLCQDGSDSADLAGPRCTNMTLTGELSAGSVITDALDIVTPRVTLTNVASGVATTAFQVNQSATSAYFYHVYAGVKNATGMTDYSAYALVAGSNGSAKLMQHIDGSFLVLSLSGTNVQVTQTSGVAGDIYIQYETVGLK